MRIIYDITFYESKINVIERLIISNKYVPRKLINYPFKHNPFVIFNLIDK